MKLFIVIVALFTGSQALAYDLASCREKIRSEAVLKAADVAIKKIDRQSTAYTWGVAVQKVSEGLFCEGDKNQIVAGYEVTVAMWDEEGEGTDDSTTGACFVTLEKVDGEWTPALLECPDFSIEDEL